MPEQPNAEQERLIRLREKQLGARDPLVKQKNFQRQAAEKERKKDYGLTPKQMWDTIPHIWRGMIYAVILGIVAFVVVPLFWNSPLTVPVIVVGTLVAVAMGAVIGNALDTRDNIKDISR